MEGHTRRDDAEHLARLRGFVDPVRLLYNDPGTLPVWRLGEKVHRKKTRTRTNEKEENEGREAHNEIWNHRPRPDRHTRHGAKRDDNNRTASHRGQEKTAYVDHHRYSPLDHSSHYSRCGRSGTVWEYRGWTFLESPVRGLIDADHTKIEFWEDTTMKTTNHLCLRGYVRCILLLFLVPWGLRADREPSSLPIGETIQYAIHVSGVKIGKQTIKLVSRELYNSTPVYRIRARMKTTGLLNFFYKYGEQWTVLVNEESLYPVWVERHIEDRGKPTTYTYIIDQEEGKVFIRNGSNETTVIHTENVVFDRLSLSYYYRENPSFFNGESSFDFLYKESVQTVSMEEVGIAEIQIPKISTGNTTSAVRLIEKGGEGIEVFVGIEGFSVPLKIVFRTPVPNKKKIAEVELFIDGYAAHTEKWYIPKRYHRLVNWSLLTLHV